MNKHFFKELSLKQVKQFDFYLKQKIQCYFL